MLLARRVQRRPAGSPLAALALRWQRLHVLPLISRRPKPVAGSAACLFSLGWVMVSPAVLLHREGK